MGRLRNRQSGRDDEWRYLCHNSVWRVVAKLHAHDRLILDRLS